MNEHTIAMKTGSGLTVIDRREIVAMSLVEDIYDGPYPSESGRHCWTGATIDSAKSMHTLEIHMRSGTIFCTKTTSAIQSLWYQSSWGIDLQEEEE